MSIVTRTGDKGTTALMYGRRVAKGHPRIEACGAVDELNSALGLARAAADSGPLASGLMSIQKNLVTLMGELAVVAEDLDRYLKDGFSRITPAMTSGLEDWIRDLEGRQAPLKDWAMPGANRPAAALDLARSICRRAERRVCQLQESGDLQNPEIIIYLNRLADLLWLLGREMEGNR